MSHIPDPRETELAKGFSIADYENTRAAEDRSAIAEAIRRRFTERYIMPVTAGPDTKHGFAMMAVSCLMIEALESFRQGWVTSEGRSKAAFCFFFDSTEAFSVFRGTVRASTCMFGAASSTKRKQPVVGGYGEQAPCSRLMAAPSTRPASLMH